MSSKVWGYIRVSSKEQNEDRQLNEIAPLTSSPSHVLVEKASGKDFDRPKYKALKDLMDSGDTLIIKSLDRLGRNYTQIKNEWKELSDRGIYIKVLDTPLLDTSKYVEDSLMGSFLSNIVLEVLSYVAENERNNIRSRQKKGIANAKAKGKHMGRPPKEYPSNWKEVYKEWKSNEITAVQAMKKCNLTKTTFYKLAKEYEEKT